MRMGVRLGDAPVGGPAGMPDAGRGLRHGGDHVACRLDLLLDRVLEELQVADGADRVDLALSEQRQTSGVVTAVLQALQALQKKLPTRALAYVSNDSAHVRPPSSKTQE